MQQNRRVIFVYEMHLRDYLITIFGFCLSVCVYVCPQIGFERLCPHFLTHFLHAAQKFGCFEGYCF